MGESTQKGCANIVAAHRAILADPGPMTASIHLGLHLPGWLGTCGRKIETERNLSQHHPPVFQHTLLCVPRWCPRDAEGCWAPVCMDTVAHLCYKSQSLPIISALGTRAELFDFQNTTAGPLMPTEVSGNLSAPLLPTSTLRWGPRDYPTRKKPCTHAWRRVWSEEREGKSDPGLGP